MEIPRGLSEKLGADGGYIKNDPENPLLILSEYLANNKLASLEETSGKDVHLKLLPQGQWVFQQVFLRPEFQALLSIYDPLLYSVPYDVSKSKLDDQTIQKIFTAYWASKAKLYDNTASSKYVIRRRNEAQKMFANFRQRSEPLTLEEAKLLIRQLVESTTIGQEI